MDPRLGGGHRAGHGSGKPIWMLIEELPDGLAFLAKALGVQR